MPSMFLAPRALLLGGVLLSAAEGCGPSPPPAPPPPAAPPVASTAAAQPPEPPPAQKEVAAVDYGTPPRAPCIARDRIAAPRGPRSLAERKAERYARARNILESGPLFVELDGRKAGVVLPPRHDVKRLVLVIGHNLPQPIPDLAISAEGFSGQLLFKGQRFAVRVPWEAVYGFMAADKEVWRWLEDIPADVICPEEEDEPLDDGMIGD